MKFLVSVGWAGGCANCNGEIEAESLDVLCERLDDFLNEACGLAGVESFTVEADGDDGGPFEWSDEDLKRSQNLSNVWKNVKAEIRYYFGWLFDADED